MKDLVGKEIARGDWVFYAVKNSCEVHYSFARVIYVDKNYKKARLCVIPMFKGGRWFSDRGYVFGYVCGIKSYVYNAPLKIDTVPNEVLEAIKTLKRYKEFWG